MRVDTFPGISRLNLRSRTLNPLHHILNPIHHNLNPIHQYPNPIHHNHNLIPMYNNLTDNNRRFRISRLITKYLLHRNILNHFHLPRLCLKGVHNPKPRHLPLAGYQLDITLQMSCMCKDKKVGTPMVVEKSSSNSK